MADKVSFTDFGTKKKVRRIKRKRSKKSQPDPAQLLDEVLEPVVKSRTDYGWKGLD